MLPENQICFIAGSCNYVFVVTILKHGLWIKHIDSRYFLSLLPVQPAHSGQGLTVDDIARVYKLIHSH